MFRYAAQRRSTGMLTCRQVPVAAALATSIVPPDASTRVPETDQSGTSGRICSADAVVADSELRDVIYYCEVDVHQRRLRVLRGVGETL